MAELVVKANGKQVVTELTNVQEAYDKTKRHVEGNPIQPTINPQGNGKKPPTIDPNFSPLKPTVQPKMPVNYVKEAESPEQKAHNIGVWWRRLRIFGLDYETRKWAKLANVIVGSLINPTTVFFTTLMGLWKLGNHIWDNLWNTTEKTVAHTKTVADVQERLANSFRNIKKEADGYLSTLQKIVAKQKQSNIEQSIAASLQNKLNRDYYNVNIRQTDQGWVGIASSQEAMAEESRKTQLTLLRQRMKAFAAQANTNVFKLNVPAETIGQGSWDWFGNNNDKTRLKFEHFMSQYQGSLLGFGFTEDQKAKMARIDMDVLNDPNARWERKIKILEQLSDLTQDKNIKLNVIPQMIKDIQQYGQMQDQYKKLQDVNDRIVETNQRLSDSINKLNDTLQGVKESEQNFQQQQQEDWENQLYQKLETDEQKIAFQKRRKENEEALAALEEQKIKKDKEIIAQYFDWDQKTQQWVAKASKNNYMYEAKMRLAANERQTAERKRRQEQNYYYHQWSAQALYESSPDYRKALQISKTGTIEGTAMSTEGRMAPSRRGYSQQERIWAANYLAKANAVIKKAADEHAVKMAEFNKTINEQTAIIAEADKKRMNGVMTSLDQVQMVTKAANNLVKDTQQYQLHTRKANEARKTAEQTEQKLRKDEITTREEYNKRLKEQNEKQFNLYQDLHNDALKNYYDMQGSNQYARWKDRVKQAEEANPDRALSQMQYKYLWQTLKLDQMGSYLADQYAMSQFLPTRVDNFAKMGGGYSLNVLERNPNAKSMIELEKQANDYLKKIETNQTLLLNIQRRLGVYQ